MPGYVFTVVTTPDGERLFRQPARAAEEALELLLEHGSEDGYFVTLTIEVRGREVTEDTEWLEKALGRKPKLGPIASLTVALAADVEPLQEELDKAQKAVREIRARIED